MQLFDQNQIPERTWSDVVSLPENSIVNPRIIGGAIVGSSIAIGSGNTIFKADENGIYLGNTTFASAPFSVSMSGSAVATDLTLTGGTIKYGKTSFADTVNAGYYISSDGLYVGSASDASKLKYTISSGVFDFIGTISSRSTLTIANAINSSGNFIDANLDTATKKILKDFTFGSTDYSGAFKTGDITWNTTTGAITGGSGGLFNKNGLVFANTGVATITLDGITGSATFAGTLSAVTGTFTSLTTNGTNGLIVDYGGSALFRAGGSITFSPLTAPTACTATLIVTGTGNVDNGTHSYKITYINASGETSLGTISNIVTVDASNKQVALSAIPVSTSGSVTSRKIYRTKAGGTDYYFLATISNNTETTYTDNIADASLGTDIYNNKVNDSFGRIYVGTDKVLTVTSSNVFLGVDAGDVNTVGWDNIFIGRAAGQSNTSADYNTFIGAESGISNTGGYGNTFIGKLAGYGNTDGYYNTRIGYKAGYLSDTEVSCVHLGAFAGYNNNLSNTLFIDNQDRGSAANDRANALVYGTFNATASSQQITFNVGNLNLLDGVIISTATSTTGIKMGSTTTQKLGFYGVTPVDQPATVADATDAASVILRCNDIIDRLQELGLIA